jgi:hypothetical protein
MPKPLTPESQVANLLERVRLNPAAKSASNYRASIRQICKANGVPIPEEAALQREPSEPRPLRVPKSKPEAMAAVLGESSPVARVRSSIEHLRALTWTLLASLEALPAEDRLALVSELELFDAAAATTVQVGKRVAA